MSLEYLQPFQVDPARVTSQEISRLVDIISIESKVGEVHGLFDRNISLCAYLLKQAYIDYHKIYFLSTSLILNDNDRPDYICGCYHAQKGIDWYAIVWGGSQEQTWDDNLQLTKGAKLAFDKLNFSSSNLARILITNNLAEQVDRDRIHGLLIIGQDREFFGNRRKQDRKRELNQGSRIKLRTYGAFLRKFGDRKPEGSLITKIKSLLDSRSK